MPIDGNILLGVAFDPASYSNAQRQLQNLSRRATVDLKVNHAPLGRINADLHEFDKSLQAANARVLAFGASTGAVYGIGRAFTEITKSFINIEAKFKSIQVVLNSTTAVFENFKGSIFAIGRDTGKSFDEVTDAAQELVRQGLKISETLQRTSDAMILSRQSGLSASEAVTSLTAALNTFNQEALTSTQVINKLANVDTNFAVSQKDLIDAISRSGSAAQDAGVQFDKLLSLTTSLQQTTARGGAVIGNALKSIFTRVQRSTTLEALEEFNIQTKDLQGNILSADVLLQNLAKTYKTLSTAEKSALSEQVAGIQQINQLKALLADLARANSVYSQALKTSSSSVNEAIDRNKSLNETLKATLNATKLNALEFSETVGKLALAPALKLPLGSANALFDIFKDKDQDSKGTGQKIGEGILRGIGSVLSGPGLVLATAIITNTLKELGRFTFSVISDYSSLNNKTKEQINVQHAISQILSDGNNKYAARLAAAKSIKEEEAAIRLIMLEQNNIVARKSAMYAQPVRNIVSSGGDVTREGAFKLPKKAAGGYLPVYEEYQDIQRGVGGASRAARPKIIPNFNFGGGKRGTIVANTDEYIVPNYAGGDGSAIFNPNMVARHGLPQGARKINAAGGYTPNFANFKTKIFGKNYRGMERVITSGSGSELLFNHKQNYLEIKDIHSQNKGEGFQMFQKLLQFGAKRKKPIFSDFLVSQRGTASDQNLQGSNNYEKLITRFPQMRYRDTQLGQKTSGVIIRNQNEGDNYEPETIEFQTLKEFKDKINSIENFRASKIKIEKLFTQPFSGGFIPNFAPNHILKYLKSVDPSYIQSFQKIRKSDPQLAKFLRKSIDQKNPEAMREYSQFMGGQTIQITPRDYGLKTTYYSNLNDSPEKIRNKTREVFTKFEKESPLAGGFIPNFSTYITPTKKLLKALRKDGVDFNRWGESPNYRPGYSSVNGTLNPEIQIPKKNRGFFTGSPVLDLIHESGHHFSQDDPRHQSLLKILLNPKIAAQNERLGNEYGLAAMQQLNYPEKDIKKFAVHAQKFYETYARDKSGRKRRGVPLDVFAPAAGGYIPNFADKLLRSEAIAKIMAAKNKMFGAEFTKRTTGESRTGTFRLARNVKAGKVGGSLPYSAKGHKLVPVFDMGLAKEQGAQGSYRMLPYEGLNKLHIDGKEYDVVDNMAGGFIPNFADYELNDSRQYVYSANNLDIPERILARRKGVELLTANDIDELEGTLGSRKLKIIDPSNELNDRNNILRKTIGRGLQNFAITGAVTQDFDKFEETRLGSIGLQKSFLLSDLGLKGNKKSKLDQIDKIAADNFGSNDYFLKGKYGYQGNQVVDAETLRQLGGIPKRLGKNLPELKQKELFIQRKIPNSNDREFRVDIAGVGGQGRLLSRANFRGMNGRLVQEAFKESEDRSFRDYFRPEYLQKEFGGNDFIGKLSGLKRYVGDTLSRKIAETQALRQFNSLDSAQKNGTIAGLDVIETGNRGLKKLLQYGAEKLNLPYFKGGGVIEYNFTDSVSKSGGLSKLSTLINSGKALRDNSSFNINQFVNRGKGILGLSGKEQQTEFRKFNKDLLNLRKFDETGYLKTAKELNNLGFGITIGRGRRKQQIGGSEAAGLFKRLGFAGGFIPNYADPLSEAIQREQAAGLPLNQIKVENHPSLISNLNPGGLAVTNKRDEPGGITQGISRAIKEGRDPKKYGAAKGLIPNFAPSFFPDPTFTEGTVKALGMTGNVSPASRAKIKDFTTGIKLSEQDLLLPTQDLRKKIQASITQAFKIDPRFVSAAFEKGAENIADSFVKAQKTAMIKAYQKNLKAGQDDYVRQELVSGVTDKINRQSGFFGGFRNNKIIKEVENSPEYKKLSNEAKLSTSRELNNLAFDNSEKRGAKLQSRALIASFGIPVATGALLSQLNPNDPKSKKFAGIAEGVSTGLSVAAIGGFSPLAVGAGLVLGGGSIASSLAKSKRKSPEQLSEELTNARGKFESSRNAVLGTFQGQDALKEAIEKGSSLGQVRQLSRQITDSISGIEESSLRNKVIAAKTDEERASVIDEINKVGIQKVSRTGLASKLEEAVGPNRGLLSDITGRTKNIVLKPQDVKDIGSLVAGALPLKFDADGKINSKQLTGLQELNKKGDFNIDEVEKVLGSLKLSRESKNQLNQFTIGDQKAIAKDAVERQLSVAALDKNNEGLVKFNNLLLRVGKTLDTLSSNLDFKFKIQNINTAGIRDRAISGASQSLGGISEFLSPELRNKQESLIAGTQIENQRISTINEAATGWVKSLRDLENTVPAALKGNDDGQGGEGYSAKGEPLKREFREILTKVIANGQSDPVSAGLEGLKELKNLNAKFDKSNDPNGKLKDAVLKFTQGLTQNISVADAVAANSKASLDQTTKINELIISLQKSQNFLGGGTFESSKDLDFSKIQSSSRLRRQFKDDLTNPLKDRIYKSRGNSFDDFFQGKQIDEKAETARRASNLGTLASGSLQLSQLNLLDVEGTQKARLEVAAAEKAQLENQLNKLEEIGQTSGDFNLLDSIRNIRKSGIVNDAAATRSLKQVPLLAEEGGGDPLSKLAELSGPLGDLSKNIVNLNSNFQTGVQGDFTELSKQAKEAADRLSDLSTAANLLKETAENEKQAKKQLDKSNLIKDKQTKITALEQKRANLEISSVKDLETDTQFQKRLEPSDAVKIGRKIGSFLTADDNQFEAGLPALNLLPGAKTLEKKYSSRFKKNLSSAGVELSPQDLLGDSGRIQDVIGRTKQVNDPKSGKSSIDLIKTIRDKFPGQSSEVIRSLVATRMDNFQNSNEFQKGLSGKLTSEGQATLDRLLSIDAALGGFADSISALTDRISKETAELKVLQGPEGKSRGLIPNYSMGSSFLKEKRDISKGIGGARPGDSPYITHLAGVGPAVVNTGEQIIRNFAGGGKDAVFNRKMMNFAGGLSFPIYDGKEKMNLSDNRAPGIYENGKLISASAPTQKQNSFTRPKNAYERNIGSVLANAELNSQGQRVSIVGSKYGAGYSQFDKGGGFGEYRNSTDYINSEIAKGNPINPENFKPVYADEDSSNSLTANPVNSSGIRPARTIPLKTIAETTKDQNEYFKQQISEAKLNNSIRTPAKHKQYVESGKDLFDYAGGYDSDAERLADPKNAKRIALGEKFYNGMWHTKGESLYHDALNANNDWKVQTRNNGYSNYSSFYGDAVSVSGQENPLAEIYNDLQKGPSYSDFTNSGIQESIKRARNLIPGPVNKGPFGGLYSQKDFNSYTERKRSGISDNEAIFGEKFNNRTKEFNKQFTKKGEDGYVSLRDKMDDNMLYEGSPFQPSEIQGSGGLGSVSLQGSQRFGGSNKSPDQLEKQYSKTRRGDDTKFDRNTTNTRGGDDRGLIESMNKLTAALNSKNKPADGDKPGDIVKPEVAVKHDINVNVVVGGEVNTQDQRVKDIIKQETEQFKQNVENRIKALENKNNGLPPPPPAAVPTS